MKQYLDEYLAVGFIALLVYAVLVVLVAGCASKPLEDSGRICRNAANGYEVCTLEEWQQEKQATPICEAVEGGWNCNGEFIGVVSTLKDTAKTLTISDMNVIDLTDIRSAAKVRAAAGEDPDGDIRTIRVDKDGYVLPSPCYQKMRDMLTLTMEGVVFRKVGDRQTELISIFPEDARADEWFKTYRECVR